MASPARVIAHERVEAALRRPALPTKPWLERDLANCLRPAALRRRRFRARAGDRPDQFPRASRVAACSTCRNSNSTSRWARATFVTPACPYSTPIARVPSSTTRRAIAPVTTVRVGTLRRRQQVCACSRVAPAVAQVELRAPEADALRIVVLGQRIAARHRGLIDRRGQRIASLRRDNADGDPTHRVAPMRRLPTSRCA